MAQGDLSKFISQMKNQVEEAMNKNEGTRKEVKQHVTDLLRQVDGFQNSANKVLDEDKSMLQSLDKQLAQCSKLLKISAKEEAGGTTTDAEKCTSGEESSTDSDESNGPRSNYRGTPARNERTDDEKLLLREHDTSSGPSQASNVDTVPQHSSQVQKKYPAEQKRHALALTWNRLQLTQWLTHEGDADGSSVAKDVKVIPMDGYGQENEQFKYPYLLVNGPNNELIVSDRDSHQLIVFNKNLQFIYAFGGRGKDVGFGTFYNPTGLAVDKIGSFLYVADQNNLVQRFQMKEDSNCQFVSQFGSKGRGKGQFNCPCGLLFTQSNQLFVCDFRNHRVQVFDKDGKFLHAFGRHGTKPGEFKEPHSIAVNNSGNKIFITDHSNNRIQIFSPHGEFLAAIGNGPSLNQQLQFPRGIFCTADGHLLVSCTYTHCILELNEDGSHVATIEEIIQPCGIVLRDNGDVVVTSNVNQSLVIIRI